MIDRKLRKGNSALEPEYYHWTIRPATSLQYVLTPKHVDDNILNHDILIKQNTA